MDGYRTPRGVVVPAAAVRVTASRSGGPGGQHVNTAATKVRVRIDLRACVLDDRRRARLLDALGPTLTTSSETHRSQARNREAALARALARIDEALEVRRPRRATAPSRAARDRRLADKRRQSERKASRRRPAVE